MNKKGDYWMAAKPFYIIMIMIVVPFSIFAYAGAGTSVNGSHYDFPDTLEEDLLVARLFNVCLSTDGGKTIEYALIDEVTLQNCFTGEHIPSFTVSLTSIDNAFNQTEANLNYFSKNQVGTTRYVLVRYNNEVVPGVIEVIV